MNQNPFAPAFEALPETLPIFPLPGVLLLPTGQLPLNIFEPRYLAMTSAALGAHRMIGMIQPRNAAGAIAGQADIYDVGCAGKIIDFTETPDGRYLITLAGICRFKVQQELQVTTPYRQIAPDWQAYKSDLEVRDCQGLDRQRLHDNLKQYFHTQELTCDWETIKNTADNKLITCLSMICPFAPQEKQALLEAKCCNERAKTFMTMLEMAVHDQKAKQAQADSASSKH
jgi:Lon protease-like protein